MKPIKNPQHDLQNKRSLFLSISVFLSLGAVLMAFEYKTPVEAKLEYEEPESIWEPITIDIKPTKHPVPKPPSEKKTIVMPIVVSGDEQSTKSLKLIFEPEDNDKSKDPMEGVDDGTGIPDEEVEDLPLNWAETMPVPEGGMKAFYAYLSKHMHYPAQARRMEIEGRVFVRFLIDKEGQISKLSIVKGIGAGCDEEAVRAISSYPAWKPGRQGDKDVSVWMIMPVYFRMSK